MCRGAAIKYATLLCTLVLLCSVGGVFAVWQYAEAPAEDKAESVGVLLSEFVWKPEEILPSEKPGENYMDLLDSILNNDKGGLNSSKATLKNAVTNDKLVHSSQNVQGGNLKHLFITQASRDLDFIVQYVGVKEFHVYMFENDDVNRGLVDTTLIKVYKTILVETDSGWIGQESQQGYATIRYVPGTSFLAIKPEEWVQGSLPV